MTPFYYRDQQLFLEEVALLDVAKAFGTPCYVYGKHHLQQQWKKFEAALKNHPHQICYAVKANSNLSVLNTFAELGSGFDIVSGGELARVLAAKGDSQRIIFSGVGKSANEIKAALIANIACFNVESVSELHRLQEIASGLNKRAPISLRINPDVDAKTHPYISTGLKENKFGIAMTEAMEVYRLAKTCSHLHIKGLSYHIGSQLTEVTPFVDALKRMLSLVDSLSAENIILEQIDIGGGFGICYEEEVLPSIEEFMTPLLKLLEGRSLKIFLEPGRILVAESGALLTQVEYIKQNQEKNFVIVDAGMTDLLRPALYGAYHGIVPLQLTQNLEPFVADVVGPVCETSDFLGQNRLLATQAGDYLAVMNAGAYGFSMSSHYNTRPRAAEVMIDGNHMKLIRARETVEDLLAHEKL